jgi:hypothetical protein
LGKGGVNMRKKALAYLLAVCSLVALTNIAPLTKAEASATDNYKRIVIVSDAHYPSKTNRFSTPQAAKRKLNKN